MNNFNEWIQSFLNETKNILSSDKQILIIEGVLNLLNESKPENKSIDSLKDKQNKPTQIGYYENGNVLYKAWYINNKYHNENGPARIGYYENGNVSYKEWWINDKLHNENGPAYIKYDKNGNVQCKAWRINGELHNENSPAIIKYDKNGNTIEQQYWKNGIRIK